MTNYDTLLYRAYLRIVDDEQLRLFLRELLPMLDTSQGCLDVISMTVGELQMEGHFRFMCGIGFYKPVAGMFNAHTRNV